MTDTSIFEEQLEDIVKEYVEIKAQKNNDVFSSVPSPGEMGLQAKCFATIDRVVGKNSEYYGTAQSILNDYHSTSHLELIVGVVEALLSDIRNGYLRTFEELITSDVFSDFLEMADYLTKSGYKDAGAVIAGSTLEVHLRKLADKNGVAITMPNGSPKKADGLNAEIVKAGGYSKPDQKNVTAWLGMRNDAAHGKYDEYDKNQVNLLISSIRDFITRNPA